MALPIRETPILRGKDAERFMRDITRNENRKIPLKDYLRAQKTYKACIKAWGTDF